MPQIIAGINGVNQKANRIPLGVSGVNRDCKEAWAGVGGVNRKVYSSGVDMVATTYAIVFNASAQAYISFSDTRGCPFMGVYQTGRISLTMTFSKLFTFTKGKCMFRMRGRYYIEAGSSIIGIGFRPNCTAESEPNSKPPAYQTTLSVGNVEVQAAYFTNFNGNQVITNTLCIELQNNNYQRGELNFSAVNSEITIYPDEAPAGISIIFPMGYVPGSALHFDY